MNINAKELFNKVFPRLAERAERQEEICAYFERLRRTYFFSARLRPTTDADKEARFYFKYLFSRRGKSEVGYETYLLVDNRTQQSVEDELRRIGFTDEDDVLWLELRNGNIALAIQVHGCTLDWFISRKMKQVFENNAEKGVRNGIIYKENDSYVTERDFQKAQ